MQSNKKKVPNKDDGKNSKKQKKDPIPVLSTDYEDDSPSPVRYGMGNGSRVITGEHVFQDNNNIIPSSPTSSSSSSSGVSESSVSTHSSTMSDEHKEYSDSELMSKFNLDMPASLTVHNRFVRNAMLPTKELFFPLVGNVDDVNFDAFNDKAIIITINSESSINLLTEVGLACGVDFFARSSNVRLTFWKTQRNGQNNICVIQDQDKSVLGWADLKGSRIVARVVIQVYGEPKTASIVPIRIRRVYGHSPRYDPLGDLDEPDL
jgi:hypothetical protein